jgi:hypothetical protein
VLLHRRVTPSNNDETAFQKVRRKDFESLCHKEVINEETVKINLYENFF